MKTPRLSVKLFCILGLVVITLFSLYSIISHHLTRSFIARQIVLHGETLARPLWQKVNFNLKVGGNERSLYGLSHLCEQIKGANSDLTEVAVIDSNGRILAHDDPSRLWKDTMLVFVVQSEKRFFNETSDTLDVYLPINRTKGIPLFVKISFSKKILEQQSWRVFLVSLGLSATAIFLLLIIVNIVANLIFGKRIAIILNGFNSLAQGNFGVRLSPKQSVNRFSRDDELDLVITSFDKLAAKLEEINHQRLFQKRQLMFIATHDQLTGLPNRWLMEKCLKKAINHAHRGKHSVLLFMDVDNFKFVNDTLGHIAGDKVLIDLTSLIKKQINLQQILARFGGDEFALIMEKGATIEDGKILAAKICRAVGEYRFSSEERSFYFGLSIGIVPVNGVSDLNAILAHADNAMYTAKKMGKNRYEIYNPENSGNVLLPQTTEWIVKLKDALINDGFILFFQPIMKIDSKKIEYYEALIRLKNADKIIAPGEFIHIAEDFGLMPQIDQWVAGKVIATLKLQPTIKLFMNLSAKSLADENLLKFIEESIVESGVEFSRIGFEITETAAITDLEHTGRWISRLKIKGCRFALDDFGSGFNSFAYLKHLPVNQLKLDGSFIKTLDRDPAQRAFVTAMQQLAQALGVETIAEFVENENVFKELEQIGVNYGQGFYLGKPAPIFSSSKNSV